MRAKVKAIAKQVMKPKRTHDFRTRITLTPYSLSYETKRARLATSETVLFHFPGRDEIDLVAFTSASQASNLFTVAQYEGKEESLKQSLGRTLVASIGPVCSAALRKLAVKVDIEAKPPKLGPFIEAINAALSDPRPLGKS